MADQFGVIDVHPDDPSKIRDFLEKPTNPVGLPDSPGEVLASMGNYVFDADALVEAVTRDATEIGSKHDMGGDIVPSFVRRQQAAVYDYKFNDVPGSTDRDRGYWRDVGTLSSFYDAHMDVVSPLPVFNLYNFDWPIYTSYGPQPPAKLVKGAAGEKPFVDEAVLSPGVVVTGGRVQSSVLSPAVRVGPGAEVIGSVLMNGVQIGAGAVVRNAILDKNVVIPPGRDHRRRSRGRPRARLRRRGRADRDGQGPEVPQGPGQRHARRARGLAVRDRQGVHRLVGVEPARVRHDPQLGALERLRAAVRQPRAAARRRCGTP